MIMQRGSFPYTHMLSALLEKLIGLCLHNHTHALHEEHAAQHRHQQLLMNHHRTHTDNTAHRQTAGIAHEHLSRESVKPQITHQRTDERSQENHQFFAAGDVHHIEILRPNDTTACISEYQQGYSDDRRVTRTHSVHTIVQVRSVAHCRHHKHRQQHKENPPETVLVLLACP